MKLIYCLFCFAIAQYAEASEREYSIEERGLSYSVSDSVMSDNGKLCITNNVDFLEINERFLAKVLQQLWLNDLNLDEIKAVREWLDKYQEDFKDSLKYIKLMNCSDEAVQYLQGYQKHFEEIMPSFRKNGICVGH